MQSKLLFVKDGGLIGSKRIWIWYENLPKASLSASQKMVE